MKINKFNYKLINHYTYVGNWNNDKEQIIDTYFNLYHNNKFVKEPHIVIQTYLNGTIKHTFRLSFDPIVDCKDEEHFNRMLKLKGFL